MYTVKCDHIYLLFSPLTPSTLCLQHSTFQNNPLVHFYVYSALEHGSLIVATSSKNNDSPFSNNYPLPIEICSEKNKGGRLAI